MKKTVLLGRILAFLVVVLLISSTTAATAADSNQATGNDKPLLRGTTVQMLMNRVKTVAERSGKSVYVAQVKELHDFSDNTYYLVEFSPTGYLICNGKYGTLIEYSLSSQSPYSEYSGDLYYMGPTFFYAATEDGYQHTYMNEEISFSDTATMEELKAASITNQNDLAYHAEFLVDSPERDVLSIEPSVLSFDFSQSSLTSSNSITYVGSYNSGEKLKYLTSSNQIGYYAPSNSNGVCGYIAAGLMLYWMDEYGGFDACINDFAYIDTNPYHDYTEKGFLNANLSKELRRYGDFDSTDAEGYLLGSQSIEEVLLTYAEKNKFSISLTSHLSSNYSNIKNALQNNNKPVILWGHMNSPANQHYECHSVLAYGYYTSSNGIIVHYGHPNYAHVTLSYNLSLFSSYLELTGYSFQQMSFADVATTNWAFPATSYCARYNIIENMYGNYFKPADEINRRRFIAALYSIAGKPDTPANCLGAYTDAPAYGGTYYDCVNWAVSNGILTGYNATTLGLSRDLTREQAVTFLYRFSNTMSCSFADTSGPYASTFADYYSVSPFAATAMNWATRRYLINGNTQGNLNPQQELTRAQAAQVLYNLANCATRTYS